MKYIIVIILCLISFNCYAQSPDASPYLPSEYSIGGSTKYWSNATTLNAYFDHLESILNNGSYDVTINTITVTTLNYTTLDFTYGSGDVTYNINTEIKPTNLINSTSGVTKSYCVGALARADEYSYNGLTYDTTSRSVVLNTGYTRTYSGTANSTVLAVPILSGFSGVTINYVNTYFDDIHTVCTVNIVSININTGTDEVINSYVSNTATENVITVNYYIPPYSTSRTNYFYGFLEMTISNGYCKGIEVQYEKYYQDNY